MHRLLNSRPNKKFRPIQNENGQGLVEYLVIVALMAIASMAIMRVLSQTVNAKLASVTYALQGKKKSVTVETIEESHTDKKDLSNFFNGVGQ